MTGCRYSQPNGKRAKPKDKWGIAVMTIDYSNNGATEKDPQLVIDCHRVLYYETVDRTIKFNGKQRLFAGEKLLERLPRIAMCKESETKQIRGWSCFAAKTRCPRQLLNWRRPKSQQGSEAVPSRNRSTLGEY